MLGEDVQYLRCVDVRAIVECEGDCTWDSTVGKNGSYRYVGATELSGVGGVGSIGSVSDADTIDTIAYGSAERNGCN